MSRARRALVVEGGGMKAAYANGVLTAFEQAGHRGFDAVYGTSAGGALAAWFAARQAEYAEGTWDYAADRRILSYRRILRGGPLLDHDALLDIVYRKEHPIDQAAIRRAAFPTYVTAADVASGEAVYHDLREGDVIAWLKATGRLPLAAGGPVTIAGRSYLDGGIIDPIPVRRAVADGATDVTVVLNTPPGPRHPDNAFVARLTARRYPALREGIVRHSEIKSDAIAYVKAPPGGVTVRTVRPQAPTGLHRLSRDLEAIRAGLALGRRDGSAHLSALDRAG